MKNVVYLCGPINGCTDDEATTWRDAFARIWPHDTLDPMVRDYRGIEDVSLREIVVLDKKDVRNSDVILVNYIKPSVGTAMEVFYAWTLGKPVVVWCESGASLSPWMVYHSTITVNTIDAAVDACLRSI